MRPRCSEETKNKIRLAHLGKTHSEETRKKMSISNSISQIGHKVSAETRKKISDSNKGKPSGMKGKRHREDSILKMVKSAKRGCNSPVWKGGITEENSAIRMSQECRNWKKSVLIRDDFTCKKTGQKGGKLQVHHIENFSNKKELRFLISNGITLSKISHKEFHKIYGIKNNTRKQLNEYLNNLK